jgi:GntR family transcriptional regulator
MLFRPNPASGMPIYLQLMEQVKHAVETGAVRPGEQLPGIRPVAEELVINPNTVAKVLGSRTRRRHRAAPWRRRVHRRQRAAEEEAEKVRAAQTVAAAVERLRKSGITDEEIRRPFRRSSQG